MDLERTERELDWTFLKIKYSQRNFVILTLGRFSCISLFYVNNTVHDSINLSRKIFIIFIRFSLRSLMFNLKCMKFNNLLGTIIFWKIEVIYYCEKFKRWPNEPFSSRSMVLINLDTFFYVNHFYPMKFFYNFFFKLVLK